VAAARYDGRAPAEEMGRAEGDCREGARGQQPGGTGRRGWMRRKPGWRQRGFRVFDNGFFEVSIEGGEIGRVELRAAGSVGDRPRTAGSG